MECFRLLLEHLAKNRASVFEWHKRFKEGKESVRDDERCGRSKEVRTTEFIGQIKNFMDKDRRVSIETISAPFDVSVGTVHTIIRGELKMRKICAKFVPRVLREDQKEKRCHNSREMVELINSDPAVLNALVTCDESWIYCYYPETKWKHAGQTKQIYPQTFDDPFFWQHWNDLHALGFHWTDSQQGILCWGFKGVQEEIPSEMASTLQNGSVAFPPGQCNSSQLHPCHRLFDQDGHRDTSSARPCSLFSKLRGCRYETIEEMKEAVTKVIDTLTQEDFHGAFQKLLELYNKCIAAEGDFMCVLSIKVPIRKKLWKLI